MITGYEISDFLAWDVTAWDRLLVSYHSTIWPAQGIIAALFVAAFCYCVYGSGRYRHVSMLLILAACWAWTGVVFHRTYHAQLNWAAHYWMIASFIQSAAFLLLSLQPMRSSLKPSVRSKALVCLFLLFCLPMLLGWWWGRSLFALPLPLFSTDSLAWTSLLAAVFCSSLVSRQWLTIAAMLVPFLLLMIDGLIAYALPATDRLVVILIALTTALLAGALLRRTKA